MDSVHSEEPVIYSADAKQLPTVIILKKAVSHELTRIITNKTDSCQQPRPHRTG